MFSNGKKTIGVFAENTNSEFQNRLCRGICAKAREEGYNVAVFSSFGNYGQNDRFYRGDRKLYDLPEYEGFDGIILALDTMEDPESRKAVLTQVRSRCSCPVVSIREIISGANNLLVDNTSCMEGIIRHFIEEHGFTRLCFMTGPADHWDAQERLKCFRREMDQHELPVEDHQVFYGDFWKNKGKEACDWFLEMEERPQAIICANDYMALAVASELIGRGIRVPEDICVSGYDGFQDTLNFTPSMTTMTVPFEKMGEKAVEIIKEKQDDPANVENYYFEAEVIRRESCGCIRTNQEEIILTRREWHEQIKENQNRELQFCYMSIQLGECTSIEAMAEQLAYFVYDVENFDKYCLCLCDHLEEKSEFLSYSDTMELRVFVDEKKGGRIPLRTSFKREELLPEGVIGKEPQIWYFSPVHFEDYSYGYEAFRFKETGSTGKLYLWWNINVGNKIRDILNHIKMQRLIVELENLYDRDALTGLYNRHGMKKHGDLAIQAAAEREQSLFVASLDLDDMKYINDSFGHIEGDFALKTIAQLVCEVCPESAIAVRSGGDEFIIIARNIPEAQAESLLSTIFIKLDTFNKNGQKPYEIHASAGYVNRVPMPDESIERFIKESDAKMYENKVENKTRRGQAVR